MKRRMTVAAIVAGVLVVASAVLLGPGRRGREDESAAPPGESGPFITRATTHPGEVLDGGEFLKLPPGERTFTRIYDRVTGEPKYIFRADAWNPVSDAEFHVTRPEVQVHTPEGQVTFLQADEGQIVLAQSGRRSAEPKRGWLRGNVRVSLDRTTKKWRSEHPDAADMQQHPDQVIRIFLDEVSFDLDRARVEAEGPIRVQSVEADIDGTGLTIAYNQVDNRIDLLTIRQGRKMALRRGGGMVDFGMPGTGGESTARRTRRRSAPAAKPEEDELRPAIARARAMEPASVEETAAGAARVIRAESAEGDGGAALAEPVAAPRFVTTTGPAATPGTDDLSQSTAAMSAEARQALAHASTRPASTQPETLELAARRARGRIDTYSAVFTGNVVVEQRQGTRRPGRLVCDSLEIIFDFGRRQRQTGVLRNEGGATSRPARETAPGPSPTAEPGDDTQLVLTWNGPLEMRPLAIPEREKSGARFDCIATGRPLRVDDGRGEAVCRQLVYRNERKQVWLSGSDEEPVQLVTHGEELRGEESPAVVVNGRLRGREVFFDRSRGLARIDGPGEMLRSGGAPRGRGTGPTFNSVDAGAIQWTRGVELELRQIGEKRTDPNTGAEKTSFRDFISRAWFHGQVRVERGDELIAGEDVAATFGPPTRVGASNGPLMHLDAQGKVRLERRPDVIRAQTLQVDFALTPDGRDSYPRRAHAEGRVRAMQDRRRISADLLDADLALVTPPPPLDAPPGSKSRPQLGINELHASGAVHVLDPGQNFRINAEQLDAVLRNGRQIDHATVVGLEGERFAEVDYGDYRVVGHRIESDLVRQTVDVPGPGRAYFTTDRDFGGGELAKSETAKVRWLRSMKIRGQENTAVFDGAIRADTSSHTMRSDRLSIVLGQLPPRPRPAPTESRLVARLKQPGLPLVGGYEKFGFLLRDAGRGAWAMVSPSLPPAVSPVPPRSPATAALAAPPELLVRKQPVRVIASGAAEAVRSIRLHGKDRLLSRVTLRGDQIVVDLKRQTMNIPGPGALLIEDYAFGERRKRGGPQQSVSMFTTGDSGPSQTAFHWANGMSYFVDQALVKFDRQVSMRHVSGDYLMAKDELAQAMRLDPLKIKLPPGRKADLSCDDLMVQFLQSQAAAAAPQALDVRGADLRQLVASGTVHLQEGTKSLMGDRLTFSRDTNRVAVEGSDQFEARIFDQDEQSQRFNMWRGPVLVWDRATNRIESPNATVMSRGR